MPKIRTTVTLDEEVLKWVKVRAARTGKGDSEVIEDGEYLENAIRYVAEGQ